jgi:hypothetical protein
MKTAAEVAARVALRYGDLVRRMTSYAARNPWGGQLPVSPRQRACLAFPEEPERMFSVLLTFDVGYHASGWWRNSQYDRCWHLSLCIATRTSLETPELFEAQGIARAFFGEDVRLGWVEPPASAFDAYRTAPASRHTYHIRVFVDRTGKAIQPQGEVYDLVPFEDGTSPLKVFR